MLSRISKVKKAVLGGAAALWGGSLFGGFFEGVLTGRTSPRGAHIPGWISLGSSGLLTLIGWSWQRLLRNSPVADFATHIATGMTLGAIGDVLMGRSVPAGMGAFSLGHLAYVRGMLRLQTDHGRNSAAVRYGAWGTWLGLGSAMWYAVVGRAQGAVSPLGWAGLGYTLLVASTCGVGWGTALQERRLWPLALGGTLFLLSDAVIAMRIFNPPQFAALPRPIRGDLVWLTYGPAQALLVHSVVFAAAIFEGEAGQKARK